MGELGVVGGALYFYFRGGILGGAGDGPTFAPTGRHETLRIVIPKGSYVPFFEAAAVPDAKSAAQAKTQTGGLPAGVEAARFAPVRTPRAGRRWMAAACMLLAALASAGAWVWHRHATPDPGDRLWSTLFDSGRPVIIVPADSTLVLLEEMTGQPVHLSNYLSRQYLATMALLPGDGPLSPAGLSDSRYTSMADLNLVSKMMRNASYARDHAEIRYARDLSIRDAKENNLVLIGGARANPWVELFAGDMNLYVDYDWKTSRNLVINKTPQPGEAPLYAELPGDAGHRVYGLVAFVPSLDRQGSTLMVAGTSGAGTEAAADFLLSGRNMETFFQGIKRAGARSRTLSCCWRHRTWAARRRSRRCLRTGCCPERARRGRRDAFVCVCAEAEALTPGSSRPGRHTGRRRNCCCRWAPPAMLKGRPVWRV